MPAATGANPFEPVRASVAYWKWFARMSDIWWTRHAGARAIEAAGRNRFAELVAFARARSPFYAELYRGLPDATARPEQLPVVSKRALMERFDDWVTDPEIRLAGVEAFLEDRRQIGERYLERFIVWKSSGTTGVPGIYVQDGDALAVFDALMAAHLEPFRAATDFGWGMLTRGSRAALVAATGEHFASIASWERVCHGSPWLAARGFSILEPLPEIVRQLNEYRPAFLASYPSMLSLLAEERRAGRLRIAPLCLWSGGERLPGAAHAEIERSFGCRLINEYGASECMSIAYGCRHGSLHVNADWVLLEPVDADGRPSPPGVPSHTVLLTNLANRVQPIIRYDLGDSVVASAQPCRCGSPLPAIQVEGRHDDVVALAAPNGGTVKLLPLALTTVVEEEAGVHRFQIVQTSPSGLSLRLPLERGGRHGETWHAAAAALRAYLNHQGLPNVQVALDKREPVLDRRSGKLREVVVEMIAQAGADPV
jgi:phenylacetate-coenzyme A ligase PaaK-like adenylate-forming protein